MQEKKTSDRAFVWDAAVKQLCSELSGCRILVMRSDIEAEHVGEKTAVRGLQLLKKQQSAAFEILERTGNGQKAVQPGDFVILDCTSCISWKALLRLSGMLEDLQKAAPAAVLLLSDTSVYGKVFGNVHALREDEMGYVCHTDSKDCAMQCMRTIEHLGGRLAREEGVPVKIARAGWDDLRKLKDDTEKAAERLACGMLKVLVKGTSGEAYNLPGTEELTEGEIRQDMPGLAEHSPLSPIPVVPDAGKAGRL